MILKLIMSMANFVTDMILGLLQFPVFPAGLSVAVEEVLRWMSAGLGILNFFCPLSAVAPAVGFFMVVYAIQKGYHFVMWTISKIPFLGVGKE